MKSPAERAREQLTVTPSAEFTLKKDGFIGALYRPERDGYPGKAVIMFGGSDGIYNLTKLVAEQYVKRGVTVLALAYWNEPGLPDGFEKVPVESVENAALTMQLNSITIMDLIAYGGAALGVILAASQLRSGRIDMAGALLIILLAADFFLPMRQLGSYFHVAMNGMAASGKIFNLLDLPEPEEKTAPVPADCSIVCKGLRFSYDKKREVLHGVDLSFPKGGFTAIVGESGCGKSTIAGILMGRKQGYTGCVTVGGVELDQINEAELLRSFTYISHQSYLFKGTVRDNLLMGNPDTSDGELWAVLERAKLADFLRGEKGLDTALQERGSNLSGGQCQRLALARALLHDSPVYIFDEATSNIDVESENDIMAEIQRLAETKTVVDEELGFPSEFHLHTLRHYFVTTLLHSGVDKQTVAELAIIFTSSYICCDHVGFSSSWSSGLWPISDLPLSLILYPGDMTDKWELYFSHVTRYGSYVMDIYAFNQTIRNFINFILSRLETNSPESYAQALYNFYNDHRQILRRVRLRKTVPPGHSHVPHDA